MPAEIPPQRQPSVPWACRCGTKGRAPTLMSAFRAWRMHHNTDHGGRLTAQQLQLAVEGTF